MQTQTSNTLHNAIMEAGSKDRPPMLAPGSPITRTERFQETYKNVSQDIRDQLNAEAEVVQIILTGIDNDINSTVDACPNACEMWKAIERVKQGESINVQDLETNLYWKFGKFTSHGESLESYYSRFYKMMSELIRNQCNITNHQVNVQFLLQLQPEWQRFVTLVKQSQELKTVTYHKLYDIMKQHQHEVNEIRAERLARVANLLALVAQQQPVYNPQNHPTHYTQNSSTKSQQTATRNRGKAIVNSPQPINDQEPSMVAEDDETSKDMEIDKLMALISLSIGNVVGARETVGSTVVQKSRIQYYNCKKFGHVTRECQKLKREKDAAYHREKMLLCKQEEAGIQLNAEQADWRDDTDDDELEGQELEAHYIEHPEQSKSVHDTYPIEQDAHNVIIDSLNMSYNKEEIDQNDDDNDLANEHKKLDKVIALENKVKVLDNIVYKTGQSVQTMNMLNNKCRTSFAKPEFFKKGQRANPHMYDIGFYNYNLALMLAPESDEVIHLEKESRSKLSDLIRPFDYIKLNNLYDSFVPQREKSSEQRYFSERSRLSHTSVNNRNSKESFNKKATLLEKRMDESIP
nr:hypothetical protein [Tanacetum cinerariifolium]